MIQNKQYGFMTDIFFCLALSETHYFPFNQAQSYKCGPGTDYFPVTKVEDCQNYATEKGYGAVHVCSGTCWHQLPRCFYRYVERRIRVDFNHAGTLYANTSQHSD